MIYMVSLRSAQTDVDSLALAGLAEHGSLHRVFQGTWFLSTSAPMRDISKKFETFIADRKLVVVYAMVPMTTRSWCGAIEYAPEVSQWFINQGNQE